MGLQPEVEGGCISAAIHDGTPNSVLESMALGCVPVVGDIESLREWIVDGENGLLMNPNNPSSIATGILRALRDDDPIFPGSANQFQVNSRES